MMSNSENITLDAVVAKLRAVPTIKDVEVKLINANEHSAFGSMYIIARPHNDEVLGIIGASIGLCEDGKPLHSDLISFFGMIGELAAEHERHLKAAAN